MKTRLILLTAIGIGIAISNAFTQPTVKVEVSADTVSIGELVELTYTIENGKGQFRPPDLSLLPVISGPNTSSSMVYQHGKMSTTQSYSYILRPDKAGDLLIPEASYAMESDTIHLKPLTIRVEKPGGIDPGQGAYEKKKASGEVRERRKF